MIPDPSSLSESLIVFFLIVSSGLLLGRASIRGISLGLSGVFISALAFGASGFKLPSVMQSLGLVLFIVSVGLASGNGFIGRIRRNGLSYIILCASIIASGALLCSLMIKALGLDAPFAVGLLTGAYTTSPGFAAAKEAAGEHSAEVAAGYGLGYPVGVVCKVLFMELLPRFLGSDMEKERKLISSSSGDGMESISPCRKDSVFLVFSAAALLGILIGSIRIPLPFSSSFSLGLTGGPLIAALALSLLGRGPSSADKRILSPLKDLGLMLFYAGAGTEGGSRILGSLSMYGAWPILYAFLLVAIPLLAGYFVFRYLLRLPLLAGMGAMSGAMTCTPSLAMLISVAGTDDVTSYYATSYPIALILIVILVQVLVSL
ncbi:MAG: hypothetical protein SPJ34_07320 [Candidatus Ornithospirochaeta sp.]|nr:hypothetical protein [Candidatus Ornithospirochaeta sp.]